MSVPVVTPKDAVNRVSSDSTLCVGGGGAGHAVPDRLLEALGRRFCETGSPSGLTVIHPCGIGDAGDRGLSHIAHEGLIKRAVGGFWGNSLKMVDLARNNLIEAYNFPQGVLSHLMRASAAGLPGTITKSGLHTFVDPRYEGGRINTVTWEELVEVVSLGGEELLFYRAPKVDFAFIRGSFLDREGNLSMENEVGSFAMLSIAQAARRCGGQVIAQVKQVLDSNIRPAHVKIPAVFIDAAVLDPEQGMTFLSPTEPALTDRTAPYETGSLRLEGIPRIVARRAALELFPGAFVNLGFGMADGVPIVAREEEVLGDVIFMIEQGAIGGVPTTGLNFGAMYNPLAILDDGYQFDFFHGGGLDLAFLGFAQIDRHGNVNSSRFGRHLTGCGGFIDISQNAKKVVFCGSFSVKGTCSIENDRISVLGQGTARKFVREVEQITFNGKHAAKNGQEILYVTERAVFRLTAEGLILTEVVAGIDIREDILAMMDFDPLISQPLSTVDKKVLAHGKLGLKQAFGASGREAMNA